MTNDLRIKSKVLLQPGQGQPISTRVLYEFSFHFSIFKKDIQLGIVMLTFSPVTQQVEVVESL